MIEKNKKLAFEETLKLAIKSHKENKLDIAKDLYTKVLEINPNHIASNNNLGLLFSNLSKLEEAKKCFEKIIELEPNNTDAHYNLGLIFSNLNELQKAKKCFEKTIFINPNHINAYNKLGLIFSTFGEDRKAIITLTNALNINPNNENVLASLSTLFQEIVLSNLNKTDILSLKKIFIHLIKKNNLNATHRITNIKSLLFSQNEMDRLLQFNMSKSLLTDENIQILLKEELLHLMLQRFVINNIFLEKLFTKLRTEILSILDSTNKKNLKEHSNFINSLAEQCWLNEYIYALSEKEITDINKLKQKIENDNDINELEISILACYVPLNKSKNILDKLINYKSTSIFFNNLINVQITEPLRKLTLAKSIKTFDKIND